MVLTLTLKIKIGVNKLHIDNQLNLVGIPIGNVIIRTFQPNEKGNVLDLTFKSKFEILKFVFRFGSLICKSDHWFKFNNFRFITHHFGMGLDGLWYYINSPRAAYINYLEKAHALNSVLEDKKNSWTHEPTTEIQREQGISQLIELIHFNKADMK